ncbi:hypothetical protein [Luteimonas saliphila]|uniref:hypothetical protein n=1 Tax=Luteimonas saliphila TaxID=2804919 RepID=UPI00192E093B|nr:hypothetical protein [Luteimonas saliphila]
MNLIGAFIRDVRRALRMNAHEIAEDGSMYIASARAFIGGAFSHQYTTPEGIVLPWTFDKPNRVVNEGLNKVLNLIPGHATSAALYIAPFSGDVAPPATWTGATWVAAATEFTAYTESTRRPWTTVASTAQNLTNAAALAASTITFAAGGPYTVRGAALAEASAKSAGTGILFAASRFDADLTGMAAGGKLALEYALAAIDESDA